MAKIDKDTPICNIHDELMELYNRLNGLKPRDFDTIEDVIEEVEDIIYYMDTYIDLAKDAGQRMENRLRAYHDAIEDLGFNRR